MKIHISIITIWALIIFAIVFFCRCCPGSRIVYCDSMDTVDRFVKDCKVVSVRERQRYPKYRVRVKCPKEK